MKSVTLTEKVIMNSLRYRLMIPTALNFLDELLLFIYGDTKNNSSVKAIKSQSDDLISFYILNIASFVEHTSSEVGLGALMSAIEILGFSRQIEGIFNLLSD